MSKNNLMLSDRILTWPNLLSALRLLLVPFFLWLIIDGQNLLAFAILAFSSFTDWLDGYLARRLNQTSRLGQLLDPAADRLFILASLIGLAATEQVPWWLVAVILSRDLMLFFTLPFLAQVGYGPLPVNYTGKAGTFALLYAFPLLLLPAVLPAEAKNFVLPIAWAFAFWGIWLYWWTGAVYLLQVHNIRKMERANSTILRNEQEAN
ncbi:MAG: CDP-alcohol phosphatidyltransferase family protein [Micrococcales bacterium]|nr:CDP-alcohol phosphatidyltransferase family protein [Micrococcales bacterium]NBR54378.1 CDP-alcohol phosphatidyltransferase family protein [Micrococcales bacterium]NBT46213.1 CDP-alcohol phosphatidyltransferase family protein [Actinomycetota bacterium]NDE89257.1 CDP-alcohol phosphatidyltransferase family protein [Micrococcales bacterium]